MPQNVLQSGIQHLEEIHQRQFEMPDCCKLQGLCWVWQYYCPWSTEGCMEGLGGGGGGGGDHSRGVLTVVVCKIWLWPFIVFNAVTLIVTDTNTLNNTTSGLPSGSQQPVPSVQQSGVTSLHCYFHFEGSGPEWRISSMIYSRDTPFWSETLDLQDYISCFVFMLTAQT